MSDARIDGYHQDSSIGLGGGSHLRFQTDLQPLGETPQTRVQVEIIISGQLNQQQVGGLLHLVEGPLAYLRNLASPGVVYTFPNTPELKYMGTVSGRMSSEREPVPGWEEILEASDRARAVAAAEKSEDVELDWSKAFSHVFDTLVRYENLSDMPNGMSDPERRCNALLDRYRARERTVEFFNEMMDVE